jgi:hypothetical protein
MRQTWSLKVQSASHRQRIRRIVTSRNSQPESKAEDHFPRNRLDMLTHAIEEMLVDEFSDVRRESVAVRRDFAGRSRQMGRGSVVVSEMQKTVKTGMSPGDEKSYLAEYGGIVESLGRVD